MPRDFFPRKDTTEMTNFVKKSLLCTFVLILLLALLPATNVYASSTMPPHGYTWKDSSTNKLVYQYNTYNSSKGYYTTSKTVYSDGKNIYNSKNELIFASKLYMQQLSSDVTESAYYKTLERLCKAGELCKIAKGTYYRPKASKYGVVPPSQKEIVSAFTEPDKGTVVGYSLYNNLKLTTQVSKTVEVFSSALEQQTKNIGNVLLQFCNHIISKFIC